MAGKGFAWRRGTNYQRYRSAPYWEKTKALAIVVVAVNIEPERIAAFNANGGRVFVVTEKDYTDKQFSPGRAANIGIRRAIDAGYSVIIKTDIDCDLSPQFIAAASAIKPGQALAPFIQFEAEDGALAYNNPGPCGTVAMHSTDWERLCGYDERMWGHGAEDWVLLHRAMQSKIQVWRLTNGYVTHRWHPPRLSDDWYPARRRANLDILDNLSPWDSKQWGKGMTNG